MVLLYLEYNQTTIQDRMQMLFPVEMRLKVKTELTTLHLLTIVIVLPVVKNRIRLFRKSKQYKRKRLFYPIFFRADWFLDDLYSTVHNLLFPIKLIV
jgi:alanine racemase